MGAALAKGKSGGGRRRRRGRHGGSGPISEINVTPMVDVMLVLLIVFMVAAPLLTVGVPIDLPKTSASAMQPETKPIMISIDPEGGLFIGEDPITQETLLSAVAALAQNGTEERLYVRGDTSAQYGTVMKVMGALSGAGYSRIGLITNQEQAE